MVFITSSSCFFFFNDTATTEIYTLSLHDALPIGAHQGLAHPLAEAKINVELARLMTQKAAWLYDHGQKGAGEAANMAKFAAAEASLQAIDAAIQTHGG